MSLLFYKRPDYVGDHSRADGSAEYERRLRKTREAIPSQLSFEMVVSNRAMPPCSLQDFMGYLLYVSHDAENLQFYLWHQSYTKRFSELSQSEQALSPPCSEEVVPPQVERFVEQGLKMSDRTVIHKEFSVSFDSHEAPPASAMSDKSITSGPRVNGTLDMGWSNDESDLKWQSFTIQPFRDEVNRVISQYLKPGAPRELNLSHKSREACLHALQHTTHPSAFSIPARITAQSLRDHSHPNFVRWSTVNGNRPRIMFGKLLGIANILFGFIIAVLLTVSYKSRWWRIWSAPAWLLGFAFLLAGSNGICLVLYVTKDRHLRPWEQFSDDSGTTLESQGSGWETDNQTLASSDTFSMSQMSYVVPQKNIPGKKKANIALEAFGTANSYGHEVWVEKYRAKMIVRKVFDSRVWVQNEHIRLVQDRVAYQAIGWSTIATLMLVVVFVALPRGHDF